MPPTPLDLAHSRRTFNIDCNPYGKPLDIFRRAQASRSVALGVDFHSIDRSIDRSIDHPSAFVDALRARQKPRTLSLKATRMPARIRVTRVKVVANGSDGRSRAGARGVARVDARSAHPIVLVVGGSGAIGTLLCERLMNANAYDVRVMVREEDGARARALRALGCATLGGDVTNASDVERFVASAMEEGEIEACVAVYGAKRITKASDFLSERWRGDETHPYRVNYGATATLARACERAKCGKFIRVTGMSVGYEGFDFIAVALNAVLSMTIQWQLAGERAVREICRASPKMKYVVVRPGALSDDVACAEDVSGRRRVVLGSGDARVHAGKVSRADVADVIVEALRRPEVTNATLMVAGSASPSGGVRTELVWDPARGMHWKTVEVDATVREGVDFKDPAMWTAVASDASELREKNHRRYVVMFLALLAGIFVLFARALASLVAKVLF